MTMTEYRPVTSSAASMVLVIDGLSGDDWEGTEDLSCADFTVVRVKSKAQLPYYFAGENSLALVLLNQNHDAKSLEAWLEWLKPFVEPLEIPVLAICKPENDACRDILILAGVRQILLSSDKTPRMRSAITIAIEDYRNVAELKRELSKRQSAIGQIMSGIFRFKTRREAQSLSTMLSLGCPDPAPIGIGLLELLLNAVEHGCLEIGCDEKNRLIEDGTLSSEIERRARIEPYISRYITLSFQRRDDGVDFTITDPGPGFDYKSYSLNGPDLTNRKNGRGIFMARACFDSVAYFGRGNVVRACWTGSAGPQEKTGRDII